MHRDNAMQPTQTSFGDHHALYRWNDALQGLTHRRSDCDGTEQTMFRGKTRQYRLIDRVVAMRHTTNFRPNSRPIVDVETMKFGYRPLLDKIVGMKCSFQNNLCMGGNFKVDSLTFNELDGLTYKTADNIKFVVTESHVHLRAEQDCRMIANDRGDLERKTGRFCFLREDGQVVIFCDPRHQPSSSL